MIKTFIRRLLGQRPAAAPAAPAAEPASPPAPAEAPPVHARTERDGEAESGSRRRSPRREGPVPAADARHSEREPRESRESRESRGRREPREPRDARDSRGSREGRDGHDHREVREARPPREPLAPRCPEPSAADRPGIPLGRRVEVPAEVHGIDPSLLDERATKVVATLKQGGHEAYIVGGAVRDLLVGRRPKDFDVATDATPEEVKALFRRAFIIGRRFRIVHVVFGRGREHEVIEVSTFRAYLDASEATQVAGNERTAKASLAGQAHAVDATGRVLRDNVWGPQIEDAARRDFTVNAMYYDPQRRVVVDYHGGLADIRAGLLRLIGDPAKRYREDPVRILRAVRFAAKLGFTLEPATGAPIAECKAQLADVPISRMFDEMIKLLQTGHALASIDSLKALGLDRGIFPVLDAVFDPARMTEQSLAFVRRALADTDRRVAEDKPVAPSFLLACLLWHDVAEGWKRLQEGGEPVVPALQQAIDAVFDARIGDVSGRGKLGTDMREIWMMQPRLERRQPQGVRTMIEQPRFRAGFDFLRLRADSGEVAPELAEWWEDFSLGSEDDREAMLEALREQGRKPAARSRKPQRSPDGDPPSRAAHLPSSERPDAGHEGDSELDEGASLGDDLQDSSDSSGEERRPAARKRRRRRRKPAGSGSAVEGAVEGGAAGAGTAGDGGPPPGASA